MNHTAQVRKFPKDRSMIYSYIESGGLPENQAIYLHTPSYKIQPPIFNSTVMTTVATDNL